MINTIIVINYYTDHNLFVYFLFFTVFVNFFFLCKLFIPFYLRVSGRHLRHGGHGLGVRGKAGARTWRSCITRSGLSSRGTEQAVIFNSEGKKKTKLVQ